MEIKEGSKDFKILYLSNAPFTPSGYGVQCAGNCNNWVKHYDVRVLANYGLQGRMIGLNDLPIYAPLAGDLHGDKSARLIFKSWYPDLFITLYDIWMGAYVDPAPPPKMFKPIHPHWIPIVMVDHDPVPESTLLQAAEAYKVVSPTRFGVKQFTDRNVDCEYIPFGIDTKVFKPSKDKKADKAWLGKRALPFNLQKQRTIDENSFVIVINGANKDPYRKAFMRMFIALQLFLEANPDAKKDTRVYVHSWMKQARDIPHGAKTLNVDEYCRGCADYHMMCGVPDDNMTRIYGAADVFFHLSQGGGFEIPLLEAMSCGVPPIACDFVAMGELVKGHGWLVKAKAKYFTPVDALQAIAHEEKAADALEYAYNHPEERKRLGEAGREFALGYDWSVVNPQWYKLFEDIRDDWTTPSYEKRRL